VSGIIIILVVLIMPDGFLGLITDKLPFRRRKDDSVKETTR